MNLVNDKKAGIEKYFSLVDLSMYLVVILGVLVFMYFFIASNPDLREKEANLLNDKIYGCLVKQGHLNQDFLNKDFDVYSYCDLNKQVFDEDRFYFRIDFKNSTGKSKIVESSVPHKTECEVQLSVSGSEEASSKAEKWLKCFRTNKAVFYYDSNGNMLKGNLDILTGSNNKIESKFKE